MCRRSRWEKNNTYIYQRRSDLHVFSYVRVGSMFRVAAIAECVLSMLDRPGAAAFLNAYRCPAIVRSSSTKSRKYSLSVRRALKHVENRVRRRSHWHDRMADQLISLADLSTITKRNLAALSRMYKWEEMARVWSVPRSVANGKDIVVVGECLETGSISLYSRHETVGRCSRTMIFREAGFDERRRPQHIMMNASVAIQMAAA